MRGAHGPTGALPGVSQKPAGVTLSAPEERARSGVPSSSHPGSQDNRVSKEVGGRPEVRHVEVVGRAGVSHPHTKLDSLGKQCLVWWSRTHVKKGSLRSRPALGRACTFHLHLLTSGL